MEKQMISIEEKIQRIEQTASLNEVSLECLPPVQTEKYYFVSYSHKDYKLVYKDIFYLQQHGFSIWYDRGMEAGKNWKDTAEKYITKYNCAGVIFFLSENSILSEAIHEEIKLLQENGKEFVTINLPYEGSYMSAKEMMNKLIQREISISPEKQEFIEKHLNEDIIYIRADASYDEKIEKINSLKSSPLFKISEFSPYDFSNYTEEKNLRYLWLYHMETNKYLQTTGICDLDVKEVLVKDFNNSINEPYLVEEFAKIGDSTFSNCRKLESIFFPENISIIGNYAFYNCPKLENIDLSNILMISEHAFENCSSLKSVNLFSLHKANFISDYCFRNCNNLVDVIFPDGLNKIGYHAFENTKINNVFIGLLYGDGILPFAFKNCINLKSFEIRHSGEFEIGRHAFSLCKKLKEFKVPKGKIIVGENAFEECINLSSFPFNLTTEIKSYAFKNCLSLEKLELNGITIGGGAFEGCESIKTIKINFSTTKYNIENGAFKGITDLKSVVIESGIEYISPYAFSKCINLETIYLPADLFHIHEEAFINCPNLKEIYFAGTSNEWRMLMHQDFNHPWFEETGEYKVICSDKTISKYEFNRE